MASGIARIEIREIPETHSSGAIPALLAARGMMTRDYLRLFVCRFDRIDRRFDDAFSQQGALRLRQGRSGGLRVIEAARFRA